MASKSKKALRKILEAMPTALLVEEVIGRFEDGLIDIPLDQPMEEDEDGMTTIQIHVKEYE